MFLIEPLSVNNFQVIDLNETSLEMKWSTPALNAGIFNQFELNCFLNDDFKSSSLTTNMVLNKIIADVNISSFIVKDLIPGAWYNCFVTTIRLISQELSSRADSNIVAQKTSKMNKKIDYYYNFFFLNYL